MTTTEKAEAKAAEASASESVQVPDPCMVTVTPESMPVQAVQPVPIPAVAETVPEEQALVPISLTITSSLRKALREKFSELFWPHSRTLTWQNFLTTTFLLGWEQFEKLNDQQRLSRLQQLTANRSIPETVLGKSRVG